MTATWANPDQMVTELTAKLRASGQDTTTTIPSPCDWGKSRTVKAWVFDAVVAGKTVVLGFISEGNGAFVKAHSLSRADWRDNAYELPALVIDPGFRHAFVHFIANGPDAEHAHSDYSREAVENASDSLHSYYQQLDAERA